MGLTARAASTDYDSVFSSLNRGPVTTLFTPPSSCLDITTLTVQGGNTTIFQGHYGWGDASCYPPQTKTGDSNWGLYFYSPAICPLGWAQACTQSTSQAGLSTTLASSIHAYLCCPNGWSCGSKGHACTSDISANAVLTSVWHVGVGVEGGSQPNDYSTVDPKPITTIAIASATTAVCDGIPIMYRNADTSLFPATTTSGPGNTSPPIATSSPAASAGLSSGAKAAIGVIIPVVFIALVAAIFFFFRRRGQRARRDAAGRGADEVKEQNTYFPDGPVEADSRPAVIAELGDGQAPRDFGPRELATSPAAVATRSERSPFRERAPLSASNASSPRMTQAPLATGMSHMAGPTEDYDNNSSPIASASTPFMASSSHEPEVVRASRTTTTIKDKEAKLDRLRKDIEKVRAEKERLATLEELEAMEKELKDEIMKQQRETMEC